jgi:ABC-type microcin C transport system permease subunit YejB
VANEQNGEVAWQHVLLNELLQFLATQPFAFIGMYTTGAAFLNTNESCSNTLWPSNTGIVELYLTHIEDV